MEVVEEKAAEAEAEADAEAVGALEEAFGRAFGAEPCEAIKRHCACSSIVVGRKARNPILSAGRVRASTAKMDQKKIRIRIKNIRKNCDSPENLHQYTN